MDLVTDRWIRVCIGLSIIIASISMLALAATPFVNAIRWW